jgi:hypothetical protein
MHFAIALVLTFCLCATAHAQADLDVTYPTTPTISLRLGMTAVEVSAELARAGLKATVQTSGFWTFKTGRSEDDPNGGQVLFIEGRVSEARKVLFPRTAQAFAQSVIALLGGGVASETCMKTFSQSMTESGSRADLGFFCDSGIRKDKAVKMISVEMRGNVGVVRESLMTPEALER